MSTTDKTVPISEKEMLTLTEAAALFGIGINRIREMSEANNCPYVLFVGGKRLIKRRRFLAYLESAYSI